MNEVKVLVVEDEVALQNYFTRVLQGKAEVLRARTVAEAERLFAANQDVGAIALDGCLVAGKDELTTLPLAEKFRESFSGPMIAMSSSPVYRAKLLEAGCDHEIENKRSLPGVLTQILNI